MSTLTKKLSPSHPNYIWNNSKLSFSSKGIMAIIYFNEDFQKDFSDVDELVSLLKKFSNDTLDNIKNSVKELQDIGLIKKYVWKEKFEYVVEKRSKNA